MAARQARDRAEIDDRATAARDHFGNRVFAISIIEATLTRIALVHASTSTSTALPRGPVMPDIVDENVEPARLPQCARRIA